MIYLLIPTYNEELNIPNLHSELRSASFDSEVMLVFSDDGSTDTTKALISSLFQGLPFVILGDGTNHGPGYAFNTGFEWILTHSKNDQDLVVTLEADGTSEIGLLQKMIPISRLGFSLVLASVYAQGGGFDKTSFLRRSLSSIANILFRFLFNIKILTLSSFFRVYHISLLRQIKHKSGTLIKESGFICMLEILAKAIECEATLIEVPMVLQTAKRQGKSKMKLVYTMSQYFTFLLKRKFK
jgi:dolichol-phosphate mannosyltransferase